MSKRQLIVMCHVRNEQFLRELQPLVSVWVTAVLFLHGLQDREDKGTQDLQDRWNSMRAAVGLLKELVDRMEALLDAWPNAVWLFFPHTGHGGRIRVSQEFYRHVYPAYFPESPRQAPWRTKRVGGQRWCGISERTRKEDHRAFRMWDQFQAGHRPMEIARREFPAKAPRRTRTWKKELMVVHRSLDRASQLIYSQPLPRSQKLRRLLGFTRDDHAVRCRRCQSATTIEQMCPQARDFVNQDQTGQQELLR